MLYNFIQWSQRGQDDTQLMETLGLSEINPQTHKAQLWPTQCPLALELLSSKSCAIYTESQIRINGALLLQAHRIPSSAGQTSPSYESNLQSECFSTRGHNSKFTAVLMQKETMQCGQMHFAVFHQLYSTCLKL